MAKKAVKRKKAFAQAVHNLVTKERRIVTPDGQWATEGQSRATETIKKMWFCGRHLLG